MADNLIDELIHDSEYPHLGGNRLEGEPLTYSVDSWKFLISKFNINSVLDLGSGIGHNAKWFSDNGIKTIAVEGLEQNVKNALIPTIHHDLTRGKIETESVDLVICTEVVEHIEEKYLDNLLESLSKGTYILMTHGVPGQLGYHHVNCQKSDYWIKHLEKKGYILLENETEEIRNLSNKDGARFLSETGMVFRKKTNTKEIANMFWHGELSKLETMCIKSFVKNGFDVKLWSYTDLKVEGAESCDARLILPEESLTKYKQQHYSDNANDGAYSSIAVFSDVFRYNVVHKIGGWWFDCDCFCLKDSEYYTELRNNKVIVGGLQDSTTISVNSGVFYATKEIAGIMVDELNILLNQYEGNFPKWGIVGPGFISNFIQNHKLQNGVVGLDKFYAIDNFEMRFYVDSDLKDNAKSIIKKSLLTHIWDSQLKYLIDKNEFPKGSLLEEMYNDLYENNIDLDIDRTNRSNYILSRYLRISELYNTLSKNTISIEDMIRHIRYGVTDVTIVKMLKGK